MSGISRGFVSIGERQVHFRYAGSGPALLLIHQSPQNSRMWLQMMARFADRYTVIAPDTPVTSAGFAWMTISLALAISRGLTGN